MTARLRGMKLRLVLLLTAVTLAVSGCGFSGLYEHLHQKPLGIDLKIGDQTINQPGDIGVFQVKYSIPVGDSGVSPDAEDLWSLTGPALTQGSAPGVT